MQVFFSVIAILIAYVWAVVFSDTRRFVARRYEIETDKLAEDFTICLLTDLHEKDYGAQNEKLIAAIDEVNPDLILSAGDLLTAHHRAKDCDDTVPFRLLTTLAARYPVIAGRGNHEKKLLEDTDAYGDYCARYEARLAENEIAVLHNDWKRGALDNVDVAALDIDLSYYRHFAKQTLSKDDLDRALGAPDKERFTVLIAHDPRHFPAYADWGADLTVSGHVHGGIARIPGVGGVIAPSYELFPHYDGGLFERTDGKATYTMALSCGLGTHTIHVRFNNPGELSVIRLKGMAHGAGSKITGV